jgi:hypothetical protein
MTPTTRSFQLLLLERQYFRDEKGNLPAGFLQLLHVAYKKAAPLVMNHESSAL